MKELTKEQFEAVWFGGKRQAFFYTEQQTIIKVYNEIYQESLCSSCPSAIDAAVNGVLRLRDAVESKYLNK